MMSVLEKGRAGRRRPRRVLATGAAIVALAASLAVSSVPSVADGGGGDDGDRSTVSDGAPSGREYRNLAVPARTSQSSTQDGRIPELAQDGELTAGSIARTGPDQNAWWEADLGAAKVMKRVVVWNGSEEAQRLNDFYVLTSAKPFASDDLDEVLDQRGVKATRVQQVPEPSTTVRVNDRARYLRIQMVGTGPLSLAEVQAYGIERFRVSDGTAEANEWVEEHPFGMFLHYGMGTMTDVQWADPSTPSSAFDPGSDVEPAKWADAMESAGMNFGVLTAKHHDGFALWPTRYSDYSLASSPYHDGEGDVIADYVDAMRQADLGVGLYYSIWDRHNGQPVSLIKNQLRELLTEYGPIDYLWFDGWGWQIPYSEIEYQGLRDFIRQLSPDTVVANNDHRGSLSTTDNLVWEVPVEGFPPIDDPRPKDASDTLDSSSTWFHTTETGAPKSARQIVSSLERLNDSNSQYLLNVGPKKDGSIPAGYLDRLAEIGELKENPPPDSAALNKPATQSSTYSVSEPLSAGNAVDGDYSSMSHTQSDENAWWQVDLGAEAELGSVELYNRRPDCCQDRNTDFYLFVSSEPFDTSLAPEEQAQQPGVWSSHVTGQMAMPTTISTPTKGRYMMVQLADANYLAMSEVDVFLSDAGERGDKPEG